MSTYYTKEQVDNQAAIIANRMKTRTSGPHILAQIANENDANLITDAERDKIATIEPTKYRGLFSTAGSLPTVGNMAGAYADVDAGAGSDIERYIWDVDSNKWVKQGAAVGAETAASIKTKYESNPNTNAFTDAEKVKLAAIQDAADITSFTAALDGALA